MFSDWHPRYRRALASLAVSVVLSGLYYAYTWYSIPATVAPAAGADSASSAERLLDRLRQTAAAVPQKQAILESVQAELDQREEKFITGDTAAQAQAQLLQNLRRLCASANPPIEVRNVELGSVVPLGDYYGAANVAILIDCPIEQLVNLLTAIASQPELIYTSELRLTSQNNPKEKTVGVRIGVTGVVSRALIPGKPGSGKTGKDKKGRS
jgi:hypothetical protein